MDRQTIVLICLFLSGTAWAADSNIREQAACQSVGPALAMDSGSPDTLYAGTYYKSVHKTVTRGRQLFSTASR